MFRPLRMLLSPLLVVLLVSSSASAAPTCKRLTDRDSVFFKSLSVLMSAHGSLSGSAMGGYAPPPLDPSVFAPIDKALPALSQCVAETNPLDLVSSLMTSPEAAMCWDELSLLDMGSASSSSGSRDDSAPFQDDVCPAVKKLAPCLTDVLLPAIERVMASSHGCCDALQDDIRGAFGGATLRETVSSLVHVVGNAFCTEREIAGATETCGDSLVNNWLPKSDADNEQKATWAVLDGFQIPNAQVCKAVASEPFTTTMGKRHQFGSLELTPYGACYEPMDDLVEYVRDLPLWKVAGSDTEDVVAQVFGDKCLAGKDFLAWASDENGVVLKSVRVADTVIGSIAGLFSDRPPAPVVDDSTSSSGEGENDESSTSGSGDADESDQEEPGLFDGDADDNHHGRRLQESSNLEQVTQAFLSELQWFAGEMCIHLPNGVECDSKDATLDFPFAHNATSTDGSN